MVNKILKAIEDTYKRKYVGTIKLINLNPGYSVTLGLNDSNKVIINTSALIDDEDEFIKFFIEDLRQRKLHYSKYFTEVRYNSEAGLYYRNKPKLIENV